MQYLLLLPHLLSLLAALVLVLCIDTQEPLSLSFIDSFYKRKKVLSDVILVDAEVRLLTVQVHL